MTPITLHAQEVSGVLSGRVTRIFRVLKPQPPAWCDNDRDPGYSCTTPKGHIEFRGRYVDPDGEDRGPAAKFIPLPLSPGEYWVRETWAKCEVTGDTQYKADKGDCKGFVRYDTWNGRTVNRVDRWRSPVTMPRWASRASIRVTDVRVHRAWDVKPDEASAAQLSVNRLFNAINGPGSWEKNPWVCGAQVERIE